jgi:hypothetical protein
VQFRCVAYPFFWPSRVALPPPPPHPPLMTSGTARAAYIKEITVTHQNAAELREKLREKLEVLKKNADGVYEVVDEGGSDAEP